MNKIDVYFPSVLVLNDNKIYNLFFMILTNDIHKYDNCNNCTKLFLYDYIIYMLTQSNYKSYSLHIII